MRFVHYYPRALGDSGVTFALWAWARALAERGCDVVVLHAGETTGETHRGFTDKRCVGGLTHQSVPHRGHRRMTFCPLGLNRYLRRGDVLVLHEGWTPSNMVAAAAARGSGVPYLVMPHGVYDAQWMRELKPPRALRRVLERRVLEGALAVHLFFRSEIPDVAAIAPRAAFLAVPTGYELSDEGWIGGGGYLSWLGRIDPVNKGLDLLVGALAALAPRERPRLRLHGYDYKGGLSRLQVLVRARGLESWVRIAPVIAGPEKRTFLRMADGYVHPSRWDSHSLALVENLALGVPTLVSNVIHVAPELEAAHAAVLAAPRSETLARGLQVLAEHGAAVLGRHAREYIRKRLNWRTVVPDYLDALARLGLTCLSGMTAL